MADETPKTTAQVSRIAAAAGVAVSGSPAAPRRPGLGKKGYGARVIEAAVTEAILNCQREGITDPEKIKAAMKAARRIAVMALGI